MENFTHLKPSSSFTLGGLQLPKTLSSPLTWQSLSPYLTPRNLTAFSFLYLLLIRLLRYRRADTTSYAYPTRAALSRMTIQQAQRIVNQLGEYEFPTFFEKGLQFALFRTYGIPTISALLAKTSLFSKPATASKRYTDTVVLVAEFMSREHGSEQWVEATSRMNCIHAEYERKGKISNDDLLYTLALFMREPIAWSDRWDWRAATEVEKAASGVFWCAMGEAMGIKFSGLTTYDKGQKFMNGLQFYEELCQWTEEYEKRCMVPDETNHVVAEQTTNLLLFLVPAPMKELGKKAIFALMDERLRRAMLYPDPPKWMVSLLHGILSFRRFVVRHLLPPRFWFSRYSVKTTEPSKHGTYYMRSYEAFPYYVEPTFLSRWGPGAWMRKAQGHYIPGDEGQRFCPMGYSVPDVGPGHGKKEQKTMEDTVRNRSAPGLYPSSFDVE